MSLYKRKDRDGWWYAFQLDGHRFSGSCRTANRREAEAFEKRKRAEAEQRSARHRAAEAAIRGHGPLTLSVAAARYFLEAGQHLANANVVFRHLEWLIAHFGAGKALDSITDADVAAMVAQRRGEAAHGRKGGKLVSATTVNRSTVDRLSALFGHAKAKWKLQFAAEPAWRNHSLPEPRPMPREIPQSVQDAALDDLAEGYRDIIAFALATGLRKAECIIRWSQVDFEQGIIRVTQKGGRERHVVISRRVAAILSACQGKHPEFVFTYVCRRHGGQLGKARILGQRYPVTASGLTSAWQHMRARQGLTAKIHDTRHTRAMTLLRSSGNMKAAQQQLGHDRIETTARYYAHVLNDDLRKALDAADGMAPTTEATTAKPKKALSA